MRISEVDVSEQRLNRLADLALYHQSFWLALLAAILFFKPHYYKEAGHYLGIVALMAGLTHEDFT